MSNLEFKKSIVFDLVEFNEFVTHGVDIKHIIRKSTGNVNAIFIDKEQKLTEELSRFDQFIQIIKGKAEILINDQSHNLDLDVGQCIIIPANSKNTIKANEKIKIISTIIKSGYE